MPPKSKLRKQSTASAVPRKLTKGPSSSSAHNVVYGPVKNFKTGRRLHYPPPPPNTGRLYDPGLYPAAVFDAPTKFHRQYPSTNGIIMESNMPTFRIGANSTSLSGYPGAFQMDAVAVAGAAPTTIFPLQCIGWHPLRAQGIAQTGSSTNASYDVFPLNAILGNTAQNWGMYRIVGGKITLHYCSQQTTNMAQRYCLAITSDPFQPSIGLGSAMLGATSPSITLNDIENQGNSVAFAPWTSWSRQFDVDGNWKYTYYPSQTSSTGYYATTSAPTFRGSLPFAVACMADMVPTATHYDGIIYLEIAVEFKDATFMFDLQPTMPRLIQEKKLGDVYAATLAANSSFSPFDLVKLEEKKILPKSAFTDDDEISDPDDPKLIPTDDSVIQYSISNGKVVPGSIKKITPSVLKK